MKQLSKVEIEKMRQLAGFLEALEPSQFDLNNWVVQEYAPPTKILFGLIETDPGCGFAGCAIGWAAYSKMFPGLRLSDNSPVYKGEENWNAVMELFNIEYHTALCLFDNGHYKGKGVVSPGRVARRLRRFADKTEAYVKRSKQYTTYDKFVKLEEPKLRLVG